MRIRSMASSLTSLRRSGARLMKMTTRLLAKVASQTIASDAKQRTKTPVKNKIGAKAKQTVGKAEAIRKQAKNPILFSPNPGGLKMHLHAPASAGRRAPLIVLLHGCGQAPESFATETGWRRLADDKGFVLLMPAQTEANNRQRCFNWFRPADTGHDLGEAGSIAAMVHLALKTHGCDRSRVFVTGLSAGAAMASCLLAVYPDLFAGGGVVAGLPAGAASGIVGAMTRMAGHGGELSAMEWMARARALAPLGYAGPWPRLSIWSGDADGVVAPRNATHLAQQWTQLLELDARAMSSVPRLGIKHQTWGRAGQQPMVESWVIAGGGHIYPTTRNGGVSAAREIARFWGIA